MTLTIFWVFLSRATSFTHIKMNDDSWTVYIFVVHLEKKHFHINKVEAQNAFLMNPTLIILLVTYKNWGFNCFFFLDISKVLTF